MGSGRACLLLFGIETGRTVPPVRQLQTQEQMRQVLSPFGHWLADALALHDFTLKLLQSPNLLLDHSCHRCFVLRVVESDN